MNTMAAEISTGKSRKMIWAGSTCIVALLVAWVVATSVRPAIDMAVAPIAVASHPLPSQAQAQAQVHAAAAEHLQFEPNRGQVGKAVRYLSQGRRNRVEVFDDGMALSAQRPAVDGIQPEAAHAQLRFVGASDRGQFDAREPAPGQANYLIGPDESKWIRGVPRYRQLPLCRSVCRHRSRLLQPRTARWSFDLVVQPGADPSRIRLHVGGATPPVLDVDGDLLLDGVRWRASFASACAVPEHRRPEEGRALRITCCTAVS